MTRLNKNTAKKILFFNYVNLNLLLCRFYSEGSGPYSKIKPVAVYKNCRQEKSRVLKFFYFNKKSSRRLENRNKVAVYRWVKNVNNKTYIGSSVLEQYFSTSSKLNSVIKPNNNLNLVAIYPEADQNKLMILKDNKGKAGIYRWVNKVNGNTYVGSSVNLSLRLKKYYDFSYIASELLKSKSRIYSAILSYGHSNFRLEILEYCTKENAISREQYYIDLLKPEYNINPTAGSRFGSTHLAETLLKMSKSAQGRKHSEETKKLLSLANKGMRNPNFGKTHSAETKALISLARLGKSILSESTKDKMSADRGTAIRVLDLKTNETSVYTSIARAAKAMGVTRPPLSNRIKETQGSIIVKKRFQVEKVKSTQEGS